MPLELTPIEGSSQVVQAGYDEDRQVFAVVFKGSPFRYEYQGVPPEVYANFLAAESKGRFLGSVIKHEFDFQKVAPDAEDDKDGKSGV